jgi:uncharacterized RDD family membrane protein YckC
MLQRSYIILIIGAALLISGIIISALWAGSFGARFIRENTILSGVLITPAALVNTTFQATDASKPVSLAIHVERNNNNNNPSTVGNNGLVEEGRGGQISNNNTLIETVRNPNGMVMTSNEFTKQFFTTFKPDVTGKYTITIYNLGNTPVTVGVLVGNLPFVGPNNQINVNFFGGIVAGIFLTIVGIIVLIAGVIVLALDRRKRVSPDQTAFSSQSSFTAAATTNTQRIVLASWIDKFIAWLIDVVIVSIGLGILFALISIPFWAAASQSFDVGSTYINMAPRNVGAPWFPYIISSIVFMGYWTYFESTSGQSIGKRVMHLRTTDLNGNALDIRTAAIASFGKAFLLPFDVLFGWIFTNDKRQRIFNRVSDSVVVKLREAEDHDTSRNITYMKD